MYQKWSGHSLSLYSGTAAHESSPGVCLASAPALGGLCRARVRDPGDRARTDTRPVRLWHAHPARPAAVRLSPADRVAVPAVWADDRVRSHGALADHIRAACARARARAVRADRARIAALFVRI